MSLDYKWFSDMDLIYFLDMLLCFDLPFNKGKIKGLSPFCYSQISGIEVSDGRENYKVVSQYIVKWFYNSYICHINFIIAT